MKDYSLRDEKSKLIQASATSLHEHITELFENGYDQGYADAKSELGQNAVDLAHEESDRAYQQGLNDAWEAIQKIITDDTEGGYSYQMLLNLFGFGFTSIKQIVQKYAPQDVIRMIKEHEGKQKQDIIQVGDEVVLNCNASHENEKAIILACDESSYPYNVLMSNGDTEWVKEDAIERKTGRHFDQIAEVLAEMRGEEC